MSNIESTKNGFFGSCGPGRGAHRSYSDGCENNAHRYVRRYLSKRLRRECTRRPNLVDETQPRSQSEELRQFPGPVADGSCFAARAYAVARHRQRHDRAAEMDDQCRRLRYQRPSAHSKSIPLDCIQGGRYRCQRPEERESSRHHGIAVRLTEP